MAHAHSMDRSGAGEPEEARHLGTLAPRMLGLGIVLAAVGLGTGYALGRGDPKLFFHSYLVSGMFWLSIALGGLFFVMVFHLARAGWNASVRRLAEAAAANVLPVGLVLLPAIYFGMDALYSKWLTPSGHHAQLIENKHSYLNPAFFWLRLAIYFAVWIVLSQLLLGRSRQQDESGDPRLTAAMEKISAPGMILFALTVTFCSFDLLMSLRPEWFSTIFGVYFFAGCALGISAFMILSLSFLQGTGRLRISVTTEHFHDLGKLLFSFGIVFWAYIAFSQFMLIWYANLPEETLWYDYLMKSPEWSKGLWFLLIGHFVGPFFFLLSRHVKRARAGLVFGAAWMLAMHWVDLFLIVMPQMIDPVTEVYPPVPLAGGQLALHAALFLGVGGVFLAGMAFWLQNSSLIAARDPRLREALAFENT